MFDRVIAFGTRIVTTVDGWLQRHRLTRVARTSVLGLLDHDGLNYAGSMAYFSILSFVNVLLLGAVLLTAFIGEGEARRIILTWFEQNTPIDPDLISEMIDAAVNSRGSLTIVGLIFLLWGALGFFGAVSRGINRAFTDQGGQQDGPQQQHVHEGEDREVGHGAGVVQAVVVQQAKNRCAGHPRQPVALQPSVDRRHGPRTEGDEAIEHPRWWAPVGGSVGDRVG